MQEQNRLKLISQIVERIKKEEVVKKSDKKLIFENINDAREKFGDNKKIPIHYEKYVLKALSYYPELKDETISFVITNTVFSMEAQIKILTAFNKKRHYIIKINKKNEHSFLKLSNETIVALLCHELAHIVDYNNKSAGSLMIFVIRYLFPSTRRKIELETDLRATFHGAGRFLMLRHDELVKNIEGTLSRRLPERYVHKYYDKYYLRKHELKNILKKEKL
ncbi:MAG: hypothetical protein ACP5N2_06535 [Candidatus Nanoarchaeia archaeon]